MEDMINTLDLLVQLTEKWPVPEGCSHAITLSPDCKDLVVSLHIDGKIQLLTLDIDDLAKLSHVIVKDIEGVLTTMKQRKP